MTKTLYLQEQAGNLSNASFLSWSWRALTQSPEDTTPSISDFDKQNFLLITRPLVTDLSNQNLTIYIPVGPGLIEPLI